MNSIQPPVKVEVLLKAGDVARILNISQSMAYILMQTRAIPVVRIGRSVRVRPSDLEAYIDKCRNNDNESPLLDRN